MELSWPINDALMDPADDAAYVWAVPLDQVTQTPALWTILSADERARAERFRFDDPRRRFAVSRVALRLLLGDCLGRQPADIRFAYDRNGKPRLAGANAAAELQFNLAHSDDLAIVGIVRGCEIGVDVERLRPVHRLEQIASRHFQNSEANEILATVSTRRDAAFLRCWTAKEAVLKAVGTGLGSDLTAFRVPVDECDGQWVDGPSAAAHESACRCWLQQIAPCDGWVGAVALVGETRPLQCSALRWPSGHIIEPSSE